MLDELNERLWFIFIADSRSDYNNIYEKYLTARIRKIFLILLNVMNLFFKIPLLKYAYKKAFPKIHSNVFCFML